MRSIFAVVGVIAASLGIAAAVVFGGNDRGLFVPSPETAVESFTHQITTRRYGLARHMLTAQRARTEDAHTLELRFAPLFAATGDINGVGAEPVWMHQERSTARAIVRGDRGEVALEFGLVRERGLWKIETLPRLR